MTALEKLLRSRGVVSLASGDSLSGPNISPLQPVSTDSQGNAAVRDVTEQPAPADPGDFDNDDPSDAQWEALQTGLSGEAITIATNIDLAGAFSDVQTAVQLQDENKLQVALYELMAANRSTYVNSSVDAAVQRITARVNDMLAADDDSDVAAGSIGMPITLSRGFGDGVVTLTADEAGAGDADAAEDAAGGDDHDDDDTVTHPVMGLVGYVHPLAGGKGFHSEDARHKKLKKHASHAQAKQHVIDHADQAVKLSWDTWDKLRGKKGDLSKFDGPPAGKGAPASSLLNQAAHGSDHAEMAERAGPSQAYHQKAAIAQKATREALHSFTPANHQKAAAAHEDAAKAAENTKWSRHGKADTDVWHRKVAAEHMAMAKKAGVKVPTPTSFQAANARTYAPRKDLAARKESNAAYAAKKAVKTSRPATDRLIRLAASIDTDKRDAYAKSGVALDDGSYPIPDVAHLRSAIKLRGHGSQPDSKIDAHIKKRAKALGAESELPEDMRG